MIKNSFTDSSCTFQKTRGREQYIDTIPDREHNENTYPEVSADRKLSEFPPPPALPQGGESESGGTAGRKQSLFDLLSIAVPGYYSHTYAAMESTPYKKPRKRHLPALFSPAAPKGTKKGNKCSAGYG